MFVPVLWLVAALWLGATLCALTARRRVSRLPALAPTDSAARSVSVVLAARDEAARVATTVNRLLQQQGVELQVIAVDDRSTDGTSEILHGLAEKDPRLEVVRVDTLPERWLGKCHALHVGAQRATREWILFADGDIWMQPDVIARALAVVESERADHCCLVPSMGNESSNLLDRACLLPFIIAFTQAMADANRDRPWRRMGVGAFNLVRAEAYRAIGGHEKLRLEIVDDMKLGLLLARAGFRTRAYLAGDEVTCDWPGDARGLVQALEKNMFAGALFSVPIVVVLTVLLGCAWIPAVVGPFTGTVAGYAAGAALASLVAPALLVARDARWPGLSALLVPFICYPLFVAVMWNSTIVTLRQGGVRWRDTFYPLTELRRGVVK